MSDTYRLIYTSRSGADTEDAQRAEVADILASSRRNNGHKGLTGVLLVSGHTFVQVLEGARPAVEATFERILCDPRHRAISVLQCETTTVRIFSGWDMASVERSERGTTLLKTLSQQAARTFTPIEGDRFCATLLAIMRADEGPSVPRRAVRDIAIAVAEDRRIESPDTAPTGAGPIPPDAQAAVLRKLLDEERDRTTSLRRALDEASVALAQARVGMEHTERHRDIWADRGRQLRTSLSEARRGLEDVRLQCIGLEQRLATSDTERDRLRVHRDIWAERTRSLAKAFCREPASNEDEVRTPVVAEGPRLSVVPN